MTKLIKKNVTKAEIKRIANYCKDEFKNYDQKEMFIVKTKWNTLEAIREDFKENYVTSHSIENKVIGNIVWREKTTVKSIALEIKHLLIENDFLIFLDIRERLEKKLQRENKMWDDGTSIDIITTENGRDTFINNVNEYSKIVYWEIEEMHEQTYKITVSI